VLIQDYIKGCCIYRKCFEGMNLVGWILESKIVDIVQDGIILADVLFRAGYIYSVFGSKKFSYSSELFRLQVCFEII
jgi:hypothetical protein